MTAVFGAFYVMAVVTAFFLCAVNNEKQKVTV